MRVITALVLALILAGVAGAATTKDIRPGDLRLCGATRCATVTTATLARELGRFVYLGPQPATAYPPAMRARMYQLRFRNGYVAGVFAGSRLDRWLSYGVYLERFRRGKWYVVPPQTAAGLRALAARLKPLRLTVAAVARSR